MLASDAGFAGVVVRIATRGLSAEELPGGVEVVAAAGEEWDAVVEFAVAGGLYGLENLSLIPGRVGAAVVGNIGAYGTEVKDVLAWAETLDLRSGQARRWTRQECQFGYRQSFFKSHEGRNFIITRAAFSLSRSGAVNTKYRDVQEHFAGRSIATPTLAQVREAVSTIRRRKLPDLARFGTAGSFFKNPDIAAGLFAGMLIEKAGLKGCTRGGALVSPVHANFLSNGGTATATDLLELAEHVRAEVERQAGVRMSPEVRIVGRSAAEWRARLGAD